MSPFVSPLSAIDRAHDPAAEKAPEDSVHIVVIAVLALMLT